MKNNVDFDQDEQIKKLYRRALMLSPDSGMEKFFHPHFSSRVLRRMAGIQKKRYKSLELCAMAAEVRECLEENQNKKEIQRIEQLVRDVSRKVHLFDVDDNGDTSEYIIGRFVIFSALVGIEDQSLIRAFENKAFYLYLYEDRTAERNSEFWKNLIERFAAGGESGSAAGAGRT